MDTFKFPNGGYDVTICRKQDILDCIDENIIDKEIALEIVDHCEYAASEFIKNGVWAGIPFIGNIRISKSRELFKNNEQQALIADAKENLDKEKFILFRKRLNYDNFMRIKENRYYKYMTSIAVRKNKKLFKQLCKTKGEVYARLYLFCSYEVTAVENEYVRFEDYEL